VNDTLSELALEESRPVHSSSSSPEKGVHGDPLPRRPALARADRRNPQSRGISLGLAIGTIELREVAGDALVDLRHPPALMQRQVFAIGRRQAARSFGWRPMYFDTSQRACILIPAQISLPGPRDCGSIAAPAARIDT